MTKDEHIKRDDYMWVYIEDLVPQDHPLRKVEEVIDFSLLCA